MTKFIVKLMKHKWLVGYSLGIPNLEPLYQIWVSGWV